MDSTTALVVTVGILALLLIAFFAVFRGKGKFSFTTKHAKVTAEGENPPPPENVAGGVRVRNADAGGALRARSTATGGVDLDQVKARKDIEATHTPGDSSSPKK